MTERTLEQAFDAYFFSKKEFSFLDFNSIQLELEVERHEFKGKVFYVPSKKLKQYLRFIDKVILRYCRYNEDVVHSYVKGRSALTAVKAHANNTHFFTTDIKSFFPNVHLSDVRKILLDNLESFPISDIFEYLDYLSSIMTIDNSIPIGFPTSPILSNSFLFDFDSELNSYCRLKGLDYTRYADDIIVSGKGFEMFDCIEDDIQRYLFDISSSLILNRDKTKYRQIGNKVKILGLVITPQGNVTIDSKYKKVLESLLHYYVTDRKRFNDIVADQWREKEHALFGMLHYARSIDPGYISKLQRKYGAYALKSLMKDRWDGR